VSELISSSDVRVIDELVIRRGRVTSSSVTGAAIGAGSADSVGSSGIRNLTIFDESSVQAVNVRGAGIGSGQAVSGGSSVDWLMIIDCDPAAQSTLGVRIGTGAVDHDGTSIVRNLTIRGGTVNALNLDNGSGIGPEMAQLLGGPSGSSTVIALLRTTAREGAAIGGGFVLSRTSAVFVDRLEISPQILWLFDSFCRDAIRGN
jgi:hypothetical protein